MPDQPKGPWIELFRETDLDKDDHPYTYFVVKLRGVDEIHLSGVGDTLTEALEELADAAGMVQDDIPDVWDEEIKEKL